jgi:hypothetical protein
MKDECRGCAGVGAELIISALERWSHCVVLHGEHVLDVFWARKRLHGCSWLIG